MIDVMLLTFKRPEMLRKSLDSYLETHNDFPHRLWIQNNCRSEAVLKVLDEYRPVLKYLEELQINPDNLGLSECTNQFWFDKAKSDYVVKIDSDITFQHDFLKILYDSLLKVREIDPQWYLLHGRHRNKNEDFYYGDGFVIHDVNGVKIINNSHGGGCCYIAYLPILKKCGKLNVSEKKVMGWTAYQCAVVNRGYKLALLADLECVHEGTGPDHEQQYPEYVKEIYSYRHGK